MPLLKPRRDDTLIKALLCAYRWRRRIETGREIDHRHSEQKGMTDAYICRLLPLTCRAPDLEEAILHGPAAEGDQGC